MGAAAEPGLRRETGDRAGCGLGADAEYLAGLGFTTTAFDVSPPPSGSPAAATRTHPSSTR